MTTRNGKLMIPTITVVKKCVVNEVSCATCKFMGWAGNGTFSYCVKLSKRVRGNQFCSKFEERKK